MGLEDGDGARLKVEGGDFCILPRMFNNPIYLWASIHKLLSVYPGDDIYLLL